MVHMAPMGTITGMVMAILTLLEGGEDTEATAEEAGEDLTSTEARVVLKEVLEDLGEEDRELELTQLEAVEVNEEEAEGGAVVAEEAVPDMNHTSCRKIFVTSSKNICLLPPSVSVTIATSLMSYECCRILITKQV